MATDLLDLMAAITLRDAGMQQVLDAESGDWTLSAWLALSVLATSGEPFTSDDLCAMAGRPEHPCAVGAVMRRAVASGQLRRAEGMAQSERVAARGRWLPRYVGVRM